MDKAKNNNFMDIVSKQSMEERIAARWDRIKNRRQKQEIEGDDADISSTGDASSNKSISKNALLSSRNRISQLQIEAKRHVSSVQLRCDQREYQRRQTDQKTRERLVAKIEEENNESQVILEQIEAGWASISELKVPQEIAERIQQQEDECNKVLKSKSKVNEELEAEVKLKSDQYTELMKIQEEEIVELLRVMHEQYHRVQQGYEQELDSIEASFLEERRLTLEANRKQIDECFENRRTMELQILDSKMKRDQKYQDELDHLRQRDTEDYNKLKMNLENNIQLLEQQLEEMRATYQLNTEKLNYNFQVLKEREKENLDTVDHQKKKLKRLSSTLATLKQKYAEQDRKFKQENHELTEEYRRITRQYKELQRKFRHFEKVDNKKYDDIWSMNHESIMSLVKKVLEADKIIHEQILCVPWQRPEQLNLLQDKDTVLAGSKNPSMNRSVSPPSPKTDNVPSLLSSTESDSRLLQVLSILAVEAAFLVDAKTQQMVASLPENQRLLYQCDSILHALGVDTKDDLDEIVSMLYHQPEQDNKQNNIQTANSQSPIVHPNDFLKLIRKFVANKQSKSYSGSDPAHKVAEEREKLMNEGGESKRSRDEEFWTRIGNIIDPAKIKVWNTLEQSLLEYNRILSERADVVDEIRQLDEQNQQLRMLLDKYLHADINQQLNIAPNQVLHLPKI